MKIPYIITYRKVEQKGLAFYTEIATINRKKEFLYAGDILSLPLLKNGFTYLLCGTRKFRSKTLNKYRIEFPLTAWGVYVKKLEKDMLDRYMHRLLLENMTQQLGNKIIVFNRYGRLPLKG